MQEVRVGDEIFRFPTDMPDEDIKAALNKHFGKPQRNVAQRALDWFKGGQREENIPLANKANLGLPTDKATKMVGLLATTASDDRLQSGIKNIIPGAEFDKDQYGNLVVISPVYKDGEPTQQYTRFYPNPKGLDITDIMQGSGAVALGQAIAATGGALGLPVAGMTGGALIGATEAGLIEAASAYLSGKRFKAGDVPAGALGGAAGAKAGEMLGRLVRAFRSAPRAMFGDDGALQPRIAEELRKAGIDPATVTRDTLTDISRRIQQGVDPTEAGRMAEAQNLPVSVPMTTGSITGSKGQQLFENAAESGAFGQTAESMMQGSRAKTQSALQQNIPAIQDRIGGNAPTVTETGQAGAAAQDALASQRAAAQQRADDLYKEARASGSAFMDEESALAMTGRIGEQMGAEFELSNIPKTAGLMNKLNEIIADGGDVREMFALRTKVTSLGSELGVEGQAAREFKGVLDNELTSAMQNALIYGDAAAVGRWKEAVANYADFAQLWKSKGGILNALTEQTLKDGEKTLKVTPAQASNYIFGVSTNRLSTNPKIASNILTMKKQLPEEQWNQLRQEAFLRIAQAGKTAKAGEDMFSGVNFRKEWKKLSDNNPAMIKALFTAQERALINQFANVSARATGGAVNASNSANSAFNLLGRLGSAFGSTNLGQFMTRVVGANMIRSAYGSARASSAIRGNPTPMSFGGSAGAGGAAATTDDVQNPITQQIQRTTGFNFGPR